MALFIGQILRAGQKVRAYTTLKDVTQEEAEAMEIVTLKECVDVVEHTKYGVIETWELENPPPEAFKDGIRIRQDRAVMELPVLNEKENDMSVIGDIDIPDLVLVRCKLSNWKGVVKLKKLAREINESKGLTTKDEQVNLSKCVIPPKYKQPLSTAESQIREYTYLNSIPFRDGGYRGVPKEQADAYVEGLTKLKEQFDKAWQNLRDNVDDANALNKVWLDKIGCEYTLTASDIEQRFDMEIKYDEVSDPERLTHGMPSKSAIAVANSIANELTDSMKGAAADLTRKLEHLASEIIKRTSKGDDKKRKWGGFKKKFDKVLDAVDKLNFMADKDIADGVKTLRQVNFDDLEQAQKIAHTMLGTEYESPVTALADEIWGEDDEDEDDKQGVPVAEDTADESDDDEDIEPDDQAESEDEPDETEESEDSEDGDDGDWEDLF